jgi:gliding motility-associated lipoprotein GldD
MSKRLLLFVFLLPVLLSCEKEYVPKPKGFNRIDLPKSEYQIMKERHPYSFEYSTHAILVKDSSSISEPHWLTVRYPILDADVQLTYKSLDNDKAKLKTLVEDSYKLANKHQVKAYSIEESTIKTPKGKVVTVIELSGDVPSQFQFFVTDSSKHFLRGALYFKSTQTDSLAPVIEYMKSEVVYMLNTLEWREY